MMHVPKPADPPACLRDWLAAQLGMAEVLNVDYASFNDKPALRRHLIAEQSGLCAYTGAPLDERLGGLADANYSFQPHIEHVKPRKVCEDELVTRGGVYGRDVCDDVDHRNLVAALEVRRKPPSKAEVFGPAARGNTPLPVTPLQPDCGERFRFSGDGAVTGRDAGAEATAGLLKLDHETLRGWRRGAIGAFFDPDLPLTREDLLRVIDRIGVPIDGRLPEFAFCIRSFALFLVETVP